MAEAGRPEQGHDADAALPRVSVVVPVRNGGPDLDRLLASLAALDWPGDRLERIVVDNGSTDDTRAVAARHPVTLLAEPVPSSYAARNRGVAAASGDWIAFTDADCVVPRDWLRRLLVPEPGDEVGAVVGELEASEAETPVQRLTERFAIVRHGFTVHHKSLPCFSTANVAVRRRLLESLGGFRDDVRYFGDMELSWRLQLAARRTILFRREAVVRHRHRRTFAELWLQGCQHGRGVAFMKRTYPERYRIRLGEQVHRLGDIGRAAARLAGGGRAGPGPADPDRLWAPWFLFTWYSAMLVGFVMGPARTRRSRP